MIVIGLTGPSGAGKSVIAGVFEGFGIPSINADEVYHKLLCDSAELRDELVLAFGKEILSPDGHIDRRMLAGIVFGKENSPALLHTLNNITHKYVMATVRQLIRTARENGQKALLFDAPLLFEANAADDCDVIIGVLASPNTCLARILSRDGISERAAKERMASQPDDSFYRTRCHYILDNDTGVAEITEQIREILHSIGLGDM